MMNQSITGSAKEDGATAMQSVISFVAPKQTEDKSRDIVLDDVQGIVSRVIAIARAAGRDYVAQCRLAADAIVAVRPDLSPQDVLKAVFRMRERDALPDTTRTAA